MSLNMNDYNEGGSGNDLGSPRPGPHAASLVGIVDLGVQDGGSYLNVAKPPCQKLIFIFDLADDQVEINGVLKGRTYSTKVNAKKGDKAKLTEIFSALDPTNSTGGDLTKLLGRPCILDLREKAGEGADAGKTFTVFKGISQLMAGMQAPPITNDIILFDTGNPQAAEYAKLLPWQRVALKAGLNYAGSQLEAAVNSFESVEAQQAANTPQPSAQAAQPTLQAPALPVHQPAIGAQQAQTATPVLAVPSLQQPQVTQAASVQLPAAPPGYRYDPATNSFVVA